MDISPHKHYKWNISFILGLSMLFCWKWSWIKEIRSSLINCLTKTGKIKIGLSKRKKVSEEHIVQNRSIGHIQQDHLEAQVNQLRKRLLNEKIEIGFWKGKFKAFEKYIIYLKNAW